MLARLIGSRSCETRFVRAPSSSRSVITHRSTTLRYHSTRLSGLRGSRHIHNSALAKDELDDTDSLYVDNLLRDVKSGSRRALAKAITMGMCWNLGHSS